MTDTRPEWEDKLNEYLAAAGLRATRQRRVIARAFFESEGHPNIDELYTRIRAEHPHIGQATVYRTLKLLVDSGLAEQSRFRRGHVRRVPGAVEPAADRPLPDLAQQGLLGGDRTSVPRIGGHLLPDRGQPLHRRGIARTALVRHRGHPAPDLHPIADEQVVLDHLAREVDRAALQRALPLGQLLDRADQRGAAVGDPEHVGGVEPALDAPVEQRPHQLLGLGRPLRDPERDLDAVGRDADRDHHGVLDPAADRCAVERHRRQSQVVQPPPVDRRDELVADLPQQRSGLRLVDHRDRDPELVEGLGHRLDVAQRHPAQQREVQALLVVERADQRRQRARGLGVVGDLGGHGHSMRARPRRAPRAFAITAIREPHHAGAGGAVPSARP